MVLDISKGFSSPGQPLPFQESVELPPQEVIGETVSFDEVRLQGFYTVAEDSIHLEGHLATVAHGLCAMCLEQADVPVELTFSEVFRKDANELEGEAFRYEGTALPLAQLALTLTMLHLPMRLLCREGCQGSQELQAWKADQSKGSCEDGLPTQHPFEALQRLLKKDEEV